MLLQTISSSEAEEGAFVFLREGTEQENLVGMPPGTTLAHLLNDFLKSFHLKCREQTVVPSMILNSFPSSGEIALI